MSETRTWYQIFREDPDRAWVSDMEGSFEYRSEAEEELARNPAQHPECFVAAVVLTRCGRRPGPPDPPFTETGTTPRLRLV
jgi:hypothetical protein